MRRLLLFSALAALVGGFMFFFAGSCSSPVELPPYYVTFEADGQEFVLDLGFTDIEEHAFANVSGLTKTYFFANLDSLDSSSELDNCVTVLVDGKDVGTYSVAVAGQIEMTFKWEGRSYAPQLENLTLTITKFGEVGDTIEGTFSGSMTSRGARALSDPLDITAGEFKLKRIADYSYPELE